MHRVGNALTRCKGVGVFVSALLRREGVRGFGFGIRCSGVIQMTRDGHRQVGVGRIGVGTVTVVTPALCPSAHQSTRLAAKSQSILKTSIMIPSTGFGVNNQAPFHFPPPWNPVPYPQQSIPSLTQPMPPGNKPQKRTKKCAQESNEESKSGIYWEWCSHLTTTLLSWLLDHPDDHAILFNKTKGGTMKSQAREKNRIKNMIASVVFKEDDIYGEAYSQHPERFAITVNSCLIK